jgi:hypothetical protein
VLGEVREAMALASGSASGSVIQRLSRPALGSSRPRAFSRSASTRGGTPP